MKELQHLLERAEQLLSRLEPLMPPTRLLPDWNTVMACRWQKHSAQHGQFRPVHHPHTIRLSDLHGIDAQKHSVERNTLQFLQRKPANHVLLWGARGTGKSSLIKALLNQYAKEGLRLIEVDKQHLMDLPEIVESLYILPQRFIIFCDDLSFEQDDASYKALKSILDGSIDAPPENVLIYATSNRRHLLPEYKVENLDSRLVAGEIHHSDAVEEKISLSERFGLWLSFYPFHQDEYLAIVRIWLAYLNVPAYDEEEMRLAALQWALLRGSRSGRSAWQFAQDWAGQHARS
ncbi:ATP-binding protein [Thioflexithrix psekupsensis]|uniref:AAA family ATPase n=1 Tax=Thioflexithrix psekupsensis TaxID=1570016 RepID=A0A251X9F1_9GAMM|nr:ATP-binding protein [Thioflexithrix psekupsensis]OUD14570.1 AAA family ATPase [Thioflexithrix psekupsensis]